MFKRQYVVLASKIMIILMILCCIELKATRALALFDFNQYIRTAVEEAETTCKKKEEIELEKQKLEEELQVEEETVQEDYYWDGEVLTAYSGVAYGPSGKETYYNLPMGGVIDTMRYLGYDEVNYPYWIRDDGVKMLGSYVMCAACLDIRPYGTILPSSLGMAIVCDTGGFALNDAYQIDIAVDW